MLINTAESENPAGGQHYRRTVLFILLVAADPLQTEKRWAGGDDCTAHGRAGLRVKV